MSKYGAPGARQLMKIKVRTVAIVPCLSCSEPFKSWDRKKNRICQHCAVAHDYLEHRTDEDYLYVDSL